MSSTSEYFFLWIYATHSNNWLQAGNNSSSYGRGSPGQKRSGHTYSNKAINQTDIYRIFANFALKLKTHYKNYTIALVPNDNWWPAPEKAPRNLVSALILNWTLGSTLDLNWNWSHKEAPARSNPGQGLIIIPKVENKSQERKVSSIKKTLAKSISNIWESENFCLHCKSTWVASAESGW